MKTIYCGSGKVMKPNWLKITIKPEVLEQYIQEFKGQKFVKLNVNIKDQPDQFGKDVSVSVDDWKPSNDKPTNNQEVDQENIPF